MLNAPWRLLCPLLTLTLVLASSVDARATSAEETAAAMPEKATKTELVVATKPFSPFAFKQGERWAGFSIDLWNAIADEMGVKRSQLQGHLGAEDMS